MRRKIYVEAGLSVFMSTAVGMALATCPNTMPLELLVDCIVYERDGSSFPAGDYACMERYQVWPKTQSPTVIFPSDRADPPVFK